MSIHLCVDQVKRLLKERLITTKIAGQYLPLETEADEVTICVHSDTPVSTHVKSVPILVLNRHLRVL